MNVLDKFAHTVLMVVATFASLVLQGLDLVENFVKMLMRDLGLSGDVQTLILILIVTALLVGVTRLMGGMLRLGFGLLLLLVLVHTLGGIAHSGVSSVG